MLNKTSGPRLAIAITSESWRPANGVKNHWATYLVISAMLLALGAVIVAFDDRPIRGAFIVVAGAVSAYRGFDLHRRRPTPVAAPDPSLP